MVRIVPVNRVVLIAALAVTALFPLPRSAAAAGKGTWVQQAPKGAPASAPRLVEMHCPTTTVCYALGSATSYGPSHLGATHIVLEKTTDGGVSWSSQTLDASPAIPNFGAASQLACPSVDACYLLGSEMNASQRRNVILVTTNGAQTWSVAYSTVGIELGQVVCPGSAECDVSAFHEGPNISEALLVTSDGGRTWTSRGMSVTNQPTSALACPNVNDCYVAVFLKPTGMGPPIAIASTHDGGGTWTVTSAPRGQYSGIACASAVRCYALLFPQNGGVEVLATQDGGKTWATISVSTANYAPGGQIVCPSEAVCYVLWTGGVWSTTDAGTTWKLTSSSGPLPSYADCPTTTTCYGVGFQGLILKTTDGKTWREPTPYTRVGLTDIACPSAAACYAAGNNGLVMTTSNGGTSWVRRSTGTNAYVSSIACPGVRVCLLAAQAFTPPSFTEVLLRTTDGGQTWSVEKGVAATTVTCPTPSVCYGAGFVPVQASSAPTPVIVRSLDAGRTWTTQSSLPIGFGLSAIGCSTATTCIGVGGESPCIDDLARRGLRMQRSGTARFRPEQACSESGWLFSTADSGRHWVRQFHRTLAPYASEGADLVTVSCPTRTSCYAAGYGLWLRGTFNGRSWTVKVDGVTPTNLVQSLSCFAPNTCWGIGMQLNNPGGVPVRTTNGGNSWRVVAGNVPPPGAFPQSGGLTALTCPEASRCFAAGPAGLIMAYSP